MASATIAFRRAIRKTNSPAGRTGSIFDLVMLHHFQIKLPQKPNGNHEKSKASESIAPRIHSVARVNTAPAYSLKTDSGTQYPPKGCVKSHTRSGQGIFAPVQTILGGIAVPPLGDSHQPPSPINRHGVRYSPEQKQNLHMVSSKFAWRFLSGRK